MFEERRDESLYHYSAKSVRIELRRYEDVWSCVNRNVEGLSKLMEPEDGLSKFYD